MGNLCKKKQSNEADVEKIEENSLKDENKNDEEGKTKLTVENHENQSKYEKRNNNKNHNDNNDDSSQVEMKIDTKKEIIVDIDNIDNEINSNEIDNKSSKKSKKKLDNKSKKSDENEANTNEKIKVSEKNEIIQNKNVLADGCILIDDNNELIKKNDKELKEKMEVVEFKFEEENNVQNKDLVENISHLIVNQHHNLDQKINAENENFEKNLNENNNAIKVKDIETEAEGSNNIYNNLNFTQDQLNNNINNNLDETDQSLAQESVYSIKNNLRIVDENMLKEKNDIENDKNNLKSFYEKLKVANK